MFLVVYSWTQVQTLSGFEYKILSWNKWAMCYGCCQHGVGHAWQIVRDSFAIHIDLRWHSVALCWDGFEGCVQVQWTGGL